MSALTINFLVNFYEEVLVAANLIAPAINYVSSEQTRHAIDHVINCCQYLTRNWFHVCDALHVCSSYIEYKQTLCCRWCFTVCHWHPSPLLLTHVLIHTPADWSDLPIVLHAWEDLACSKLGIVSCSVHFLYFFPSGSHRTIQRLMPSKSIPRGQTSLQNDVCICPLGIVSQDCGQAGAYLLLPKPPPAHCFQGTGFVCQTLRFLTVEI